MQICWLVVFGIIEKLVSHNSMEVNFFHLSLSLSLHFYVLYGIISSLTWSMLIMSSQELVGILFVYFLCFFFFFFLISNRLY